jgi:hypothetical protein
MLKTEADGETVRPGDQTTTLGSPTARTCDSPSSPTSPTSPPSLVAPRTSTAAHAAPLTPLVPRTALASTSTAAPPVALELQPLHYSHHPWAMQEPPAPPLHQQSPLTKAIPVAPPINHHPMSTWVKRGFRHLRNKLTKSATSTSTFSLVPSSVRATLTEPNWCYAMEEEFATLIANNT